MDICLYSGDEFQFISFPDLYPRRPRYLPVVPAQGPQGDIRSCPSTK